jgi:hypothetical protein
MTQLNFNEIVEAARTHFENALADIENAHTRIEHIRATTLANEAEQLYADLVHYQNLLMLSSGGCSSCSSGSDCCSAA